RHVAHHRPRRWERASPCEDRAPVVAGCATTGRAAAARTCKGRLQVARRVLRGVLVMVALLCSPSGLLLRQHHGANKRGCREAVNQRARRESPADGVPAEPQTGLRRSGASNAGCCKPASVLSPRIAETESTNAEVRDRQQQMRALCNGYTSRALVLEEPQKRVNVG